MEKIVTDERIWPVIGDKLIHQRRKKRDPIEAEVIFVDSVNGKITLKIGEEIFHSLTAAANFMAGWSCNGWIYWGLKKQTSKRIE